MRRAARRLRGLGCALALALAGCASTPPVELPPGTLLLGEVSHALTRQDVDAGNFAPGDQRPELKLQLAQAGFSDAEIDQGRALVVTDYIYWHNTASGIKRRQRGLALAPEGLRIEPGNVVEFEIREARQPAIVRRIRAQSLALGGCYYGDVQTSTAHQVMGALSLVGASGSASLYCRGIEREGWQRPRTLWHRLPGSAGAADAEPADRATAVVPTPTPVAAPATDAAPRPAPAAQAQPAVPEGMATLILYRSTSYVGSFMDIPVWVDAQKATALAHNTCDVLLVPAGSHVVSAGAPTFGLGFPRLEVTVTADAGARLVVEYSVDMAAFNRAGLEAVFKPGEWAKRVFHLASREATADDRCALRGPAKALRPVAPR